MRLAFPVVKVLFASLAVGLMSGCSASFVPSAVQPNETQIGNIQGSVHGGQAPVTGAHIYLYAAGTGGFGTSATSLIRSTALNAFEDGNGNYYVMTDGNGNFALGGDYTCTEGTQVYMVAVGGNPGISGTVDNTAIVQMAGLAQCPAAGNLAAQVPFLVINEVTTVAFAYAMSGFATTPFNVSSNATNSLASATAIANAMANANNIVNLKYGVPQALSNGNPNSVIPQQKIYALANILATCVNTSGPGTGTACNQLFAAAKDSSGNNATDEASAIFNIAHNQGQNVNAIWNLMPSTPVFGPNLTGQPADWTIPIVYNNVVSQFGTNTSNQVTSGAYNIAFDASGNAWIGDQVKGVVKMTPQGTTTTYNPGFSMVKGIAISPDSSQIWVADYSGGTNRVGQIDILNSSGALITLKTPLTGADFDGPSAIAVDAAGNAFAVNELSASVVMISSAGKEVNHTSVNGLTTPAWISIDGNNNMWLPSTTTALVGLVPFTYNQNGDVNPGKATTINADDSYGVAVDSNNNAWFATNDITAGGAPNNEQLEEIVQTVAKNKTITYGVSATHPGSGSNGGALGIPYKISVDGGNNVWMANEFFQTVSEWSQSLNTWLGVPGTTPTGYSNGSSGTTLSATPDPSGNLWTANTDGSVTQLLGLATPTASPIHPGVLGSMP